MNRTDSGLVIDLLKRNLPSVYHLLDGIVCSDLIVGFDTHLMNDLFHTPSSIKVPRTHAGDKGLYSTFEIPPFNFPAHCVCYQFGIYRHLQQPVGGIFDALFISQANMPTRDAARGTKLRTGTFHLLLLPHP